MKTKFEKIIRLLPPSMQRHFEMLFASAAENHLTLVRSGQKRFQSYTELKKHQRRVRRGMFIFLLAVIFLLIGVLVGPIFFPQPVESEIYIPSGKGDILLGNTSKNQTTVIFKTLDGANGNKPLATKARIEVYNDQNYTNLERGTNEDDYAVTHIIPVDSLQENHLYYIRIIATDAATPVHSKAVSFWGDGNDPIKVYTTGELAQNCVTPTDGKKNVPTQSIVSDGNVVTTKPVDNASLQISDVQNENYLQPDNKVQTIISWITNLPASTVITVGEEKSGEKRQLTISDQEIIKHAAILTTLKTSTTYYFTVRSVDSHGNVVDSEEYSLRTPRAQENVVQKITDNFKQLLHQIKPN